MQCDVRERYLPARLEEEEEEEEEEELEEEKKTKTLK